jgi:hypothetical protein
VAPRVARLDIRARQDHRRKGTWMHVAR